MFQQIARANTRFLLQTPKLVKQPKVWFSQFNRRQHIQNADFKQNQHNERINVLNKLQFRPKYEPKKEPQLQEQQQLQQLTREERLKQREDDLNRTNKAVIQRELKNDSIQLPLKVIAYYMAPVSLQATFFAELIRSGIDGLNHVVLFAMNYVKMGPSEKYPYGIEKLKNIAVLIPSTLFIFLGLELITETALSLLEAHEVAAAAFSVNSTMLYAVSIGVEMFIIRRNLMDAIKLKQKNQAQNGPAAAVAQKKPKSWLRKKEKDNRRGFGYQLEGVTTKNDPLLQAILYENLITFISTSVPMICSLVTYYYPLKIVEVIGSSIISSISIYLGVHLFHASVTQLVGEQQVDIAVQKRIVHLISSNRFIIGISEVKAVKFGSEKFRLQAKIAFNIEKLNEKVMSSERVSLSQAEAVTLKSHKGAVRQTISIALTELMREAQRQIDEIQHSIQNEFPNCQHIDLEFGHIETEEDSFKHIQSIQSDTFSSKYELLTKKAEEDDKQIKDFGMWVSKEAEQLLLAIQTKKNGINQEIDQSEVAKQPGDEYLGSVDHLDNHFEAEILDNFEKSQDDHRFEAYRIYVETIDDVQRK